MKPRKKAFVIGILILTAYGVLISQFVDSEIIVMLADIISGLSVIGIAVFFYPFFKKINLLVSKTYLFLKLLEGSLMVIGGIIFLNQSLHSIKNWIYNYPHLYTFIISGALFYWLLYQSKVVPRFISIWGVTAIISLFIKTVLGVLGFSHTFIDTLLILIITNEVFLAFWLILKGVN